MNFSKELDKSKTINEQLISIANWLENPENELFVNCDDGKLEIVAAILVSAADTLKEGAEIVAEPVNTKESLITPESLDEIAAMANALDASDDEALQKQASVLDELLMTISADRSALLNFKLAEDKRLDELKKKYENVKKQLDEMGKIADAVKEIEKSPAMKEYRSLEFPLKTHYCPDHAGAQISRVDQDAWKCSLDGKTYNYAEGFTLMDGSKVPGGSVEGQSNIQQYMNNHQVFDEDTRENRMGNHK